MGDGSGDLNSSSATSCAAVPSAVWSPAPLCWPRSCHFFCTFSLSSLTLPSSLLSSTPWLTMRMSCAVLTMMSYEMPTRAPSILTEHVPSLSTIPHDFGYSQYAKRMSFITVRIPSMETVDPKPA